MIPAQPMRGQIADEPQGPIMDGMPAPKPGRPKIDGQGSLAVDARPNMVPPHGMMHGPQGKLFF